MPYIGGLTRDLCIHQLFMRSKEAFDAPGPFILNFPLNTYTALPVEQVEAARDEEDEIQIESPRWPQAASINDGSLLHLLYLNWRW